MSEEKTLQGDFTQVPKGTLTSIKDIGFVEDKNSKHRKTMEVRKIIFFIF